MDELEKYIHNHPKMKEFNLNGELYKSKINILKKILDEVVIEFNNL